MLFYNRVVANTVRSGLDRGLPITCTTFHSLARRLIEAVDKIWWNANKAKSDEFWSLAVPLKLFDLPHDTLPKYDAVIVDEGQDFKRDWYSFLEELLTDKEKGRLESGW